MTIDYKWHNAPQELPDCDCICVTDNGYSYSINMWDKYHDCWDDQDGDDFAMSKDTELKWMALEIEEDEL